MEASRRGGVPVAIVSGFLGAGKTTLLRRVLENVAGLRVAAIVNDLGSVGLDARELARVGAGDGAVRSIVGLENGCICCTLQKELIFAIEELAATGDFDVVLVESTGVGDPLHEIAPSLFRAKGCLWFGEDVNVAWSLQLAGKSTEIKADGNWYAETYHSWCTGDPELERLLGPIWQPLLGDRRQELVLIGSHLDWRGIQARLDECLLTREEFTALVPLLKNAEQR
ncbi:MAG: GTP-binding protein [Promethearchaeota archaeon]